MERRKPEQNVGVYGCYYTYYCLWCVTVLRGKEARERGRSLLRIRTFVVGKPAAAPSRFPWFTGVYKRFTACKNPGNSHLRSSTYIFCLYLSALFLDVFSISFILAEFFFQCIFSLILLYGNKVLPNGGALRPWARSLLFLSISPYPSICILHEAFNLKMHLMTHSSGKSCRKSSEVSNRKET